jgi:hypothetical protein
MYLSRAQCLRALEGLVLTTILYTSPSAGPDNALIPLQRMLDAAAQARGEEAPTITADGHLWRKRAGRQPEWLQEVYSHLAWCGLPIQDITAWHLAHLLRKTYRTGHGPGQPARKRMQVA